MSEDNTPSGDLNSLRISGTAGAGIEDAIALIRKTRQQTRKSRGLLYNWFRYSRLQRQNTHKHDLNPSRLHRPVRRILEVVRFIPIDHILLRALVLR